MQLGQWLDRPHGPHTQSLTDPQMSSVSVPVCSDTHTNFDTILKLLKVRGKETFFLSFFFLLFRATPVAHGSSQARGQTRVAAASLHHSHNNARYFTH